MNGKVWTMGVGIFILTACSDPVPPPAQGAFAYCATGSGNVAGAVSSAGVDTGTLCPPDNDSAFTVTSAREVDGENNAEFSCTVGSDGSFDIEGTVGGTTRLVAQGSAVDGSTINFVSLKETGSTLSSSDCVLTKVHDVAAGRIWASFSCAGMDDAEDSSASCPVTGCFVFENCSE